MNPGGGLRGRHPPPPSLLGKQSQSGNICFTVGQYWLIIKINGTNSVITPPSPRRRQQFWKDSPENFFDNAGTIRKIRAFLSAPLIFSFPYAHVYSASYDQTTVYCIMSTTIESFIQFVDFKDGLIKLSKFL
jgi:hypothetical protein